MKTELQKQEEERKNSERTEALDLVNVTRNCEEF